MVLQAALDGLTDPQRAVGRELEATPPVELLDGADQSEHALLHEVLHREPVTLVAARLRHDQTEVRVDHPLLGLEVALLDPLGQLDLLCGGQQRIRAGAAQEQLQGVPGPGLGRVHGAQLGATTSRSVRVSSPAATLPGRRRGCRTAGPRPLGGFCSVATRARSGVATLGIKVAQWNLRINLVRSASNYSMVRR